MTVVYNAANYIEQAIRSVVSQKTEEIEYIIIDAGSNDGTLDIIKRYQESIDYWVSEPDKGIFDAMNKGIDLAKGKYINFLNADDYFRNGIFKKVISDIKGNPDVVMFFGDVDVLFLNGKLARRDIGRSDTDVIGMYVPHQGCFIKQKVHKNFPYNLKYSIHADRVLITQLLLGGYEFKALGYTVADYRLGGESDNQELALEERRRYLMHFHDAIDNKEYQHLVKDRFHEYVFLENYYSFLGKKALGFTILLQDFPELLLDRRLIQFLPGLALKSVIGVKAFKAINKRIKCVLLSFSNR